ncbi:hypothetical protein TRFO_28017 [Tritrichomonas foetus]|uniref:Uncharacterized protein n=1 Tax=Tritrichomonas foetus TaxID=1144522 RepID=A0A1J4K141_9EUKA|nr:hypothetical protein TRFO_28017 [Tritrichomonas foetus]|eukprot:OHT04504.1 hypothetical protein TRFO_28017 [Tritrichomonas foetus]
MKLSLQSATKEFRSKNQKEIPKQEGLSLLSSYHKHFTNLIMKSKNNDSAIAEAYSRLALTDDPSSILKLTRDTIKSLPNFSQKLNDLKKEVENERKKSETVATLLKTLNDLKKEYGEQVAIVRKTVTSKSQIDADISISEFQRKLRESQNSLRNVLSYHNSVKLQRDEKMGELEMKEADSDNQSMIREEQIRSLKTELNDTTSALNQVERQNEEIERNNKIPELIEEIETLNIQLNNFDQLINELRTKIQEKRNDQDKSSIFFENTISSLQKSIEKIEKELEELPSPAEWQKMKNEYQKIKIFIEKEQTKNEIEQQISQIHHELEIKRKELENKNQEYSKILQNIDKEEKLSQHIINELKVNSKSSNNEVISVLQSQISDLSLSQNKNMRNVLVLQQENQEKRREKESIEEEIIQLKKQIKNANFDPENLKVVYVQNENIEKQTDEKNGITQKIADLCFSNRTFRLSIFIYIIFLHFLVYLISFTSFMKNM